MIEQRGSFLPWFINKIEWLGFNEGLISFEEITSVEKAKENTKKGLYLTEKDFELFFKKDAEGLNYLIGYKASEESRGDLGIIKEIIENPGQVLCFAVKDNHEFVIPLVDEFILNINKRKKEIIFILPEGLLDL